MQAAKRKKKQNKKPWKNVSRRKNTRKVSLAIQTTKFQTVYVLLTKNREVKADLYKTAMTRRKEGFISGQIMPYNKPSVFLALSFFTEKYRNIGLFVQTSSYRLGLYKKSSVRYFSVRTSRSVDSGLVMWRK